MIGGFFIKAYIEIGNINTYYDLNLLMYKSEIPSINEEVEYHPVDGRKGTLTEKTGTFKDRVLKFGFDLKRIKNESLEEFSERLFYVEDTLNNCTGKDLVYFSNQNYKYIVKNIKINTIEDTLCHDIQLEITCEPFRYLNFEEEIILTKHETIYYSGSMPGECKIKIYGSGNVQLTINSETIQVKNIDEYVELDSKLLLCLNKDKTSKTIDMIGDFPILTKGTNNISWIGNVSKVEILPRTAFK